MRVFPLYGYSLDSASERGMTRTSPRTSMRGPEEDKRGFHLRSPCQYLPHAVFPPPLRTVSFADIPWIPHHVRNDPIQRELQSPEALFVARPGYDPGTFPILYRDALTLRYQLLDIYSTLLILYLSLPSHGGPFLRIGFAIHQFPRPAASGTRRSSRIVLRQASGYIVSITYIVSIACT